MRRLLTAIYSFVIFHEKMGVESNKHLFLLLSTKHDLFCQQLLPLHRVLMGLYANGDIELLMGVALSSLLCHCSLAYQLVVENKLLMGIALSSLYFFPHFINC
jgi:hypothetical protein